MYCTCLFIVLYVTNNLCVLTTIRTIVKTMCLIGCTTITATIERLLAKHVIMSHMLHVQFLDCNELIRYHYLLMTMPDN